MNIERHKESIKWQFYYEPGNLIVTIWKNTFYICWRKNCSYCKPLQQSEVEK